MIKQYGDLEWRSWGRSILLDPNSSARENFLEAVNKKPASNTTICDYFDNYLGQHIDGDQDITISILDKEGEARPRITEFEYKNMAQLSCGFTIDSTPQISYQDASLGGFWGYQLINLIRNGTVAPAVLSCDKNDEASLRASLRYLGVTYSGLRGPRTLYSNMPLSRLWWLSELTNSVYRHVTNCIEEQEELSQKIQEIISIDTDITDKILSGASCIAEPIILGASIAYCIKNKDPKALKQDCIPKVQDLYMTYNLSSMPPKELLEKLENTD